MQAAKLIPALLIGAILLLGGVFFFVPDCRPGVVDKWFLSAQGFSSATSAEDALGKLQKAIEKRNYRAAKLYLAGDYLEQFDKGYRDALELAAALDELKDVMKTTGVKSDRVGRIIYWLDPFPPFKYEVANTSEDATLAVIHWREDYPRVNVADSHVYNIDTRMLHSLLPSGLPLPAPLTVRVKQSGGVWVVELPVSFGDRHLRDCVHTLDKKATNYRNALRDVKNNIKNNPAVKEQFEAEFRSNLSKAN